MNRFFALAAIDCARKGDREGAAFCVSNVDKPDNYMEVFMQLSDDPDKIHHQGKVITRAEMETASAIRARVGIQTIKTTLNI